MTTRFYSSVASEKTLTGTITGGATSMVVSNTIGLPTSFPYTLAVDYETISEELVNVTNAAGSTLTIDRGIDGTGATGHTAGARVRHVTSARDFSDSRNHENADDGIHGLAPGDEIVGTLKVQTLSNKTAVNLQGTLLNPDVNLTGTAVTTFARSPAGTATDAALSLMNGAEETMSLRNNGDLRIRNPLADDTTVSTRRFRVVMSDGTTERFQIVTTGMATSSPRAGTSDIHGGYKVIDPGDSFGRKLIQVRNSTDTTDRFVVRGSGAVDITSADPAASALDVQGAAGQSTQFFRILDSTGTAFVFVDPDGELNAERTLDVLNLTNPASIVLTVFGHTTQTADLQIWGNGAGTVIARVRNDGTSDFTGRSFTSGVFTAGAGWTMVNQASVSKAGIATIHIAMTRTGGTLTPTAAGQLSPPSPLGTIAAAFRPHPTFAGRIMTWTATNGAGTGSYIVDPVTGDCFLQTWSTGGSFPNGNDIQMTMTYPLMNP